MGSRLWWRWGYDRDGIHIHTRWLPLLSSGQSRQGGELQGEERKPGTGPDAIASEIDFDPK